MSESELEVKLKSDKSIHQVIKSFNKSNEAKYSGFHILAIDKNEKCGKFYLCFKHITDKIKFIEDWKFGNVYEIITNDIVKPYFDIDYKSEDKYKTEEQVKEILNGFLKEYNDYFRTNATEEITYCYGKRCGKTDKWKSIHIVIDTHKITKTANKDFVDGINKMRSGFKKIVGGLDGKIYTHNRLFSLPMMKKFNGDTYFEFIYCWDCDVIKYGNNELTSKYLINDVKNCVFNDYHENPQSYNEDITNKEIKKEVIIEKQKKTIESKEIVKINPQNIVDKLLEHLPQEFYNDAIWNKISRQIVLNRFVGWEKWLIESANKTTDYTHEQNKKWGGKQNDKFLSSNINKYLQQLNEIYDLVLVWDLFNYFTDEISEWICAKTEISQTDLTRCVMDYKKQQEKKKTLITEMCVGNNFIYNMKKQILINDLTKTIYHYGLETGYNNQYGVDTSKFKTITQDEIVEEMKKFLNSINRLSGWKMLWGSGKTHFGVHTIIEHAREHERRVLFITENNNLNTEMAKKFDGVSHQPHHKERHNDIQNESLIITSMESLGKMLNYNHGKAFDYILFDEYESVINHLLSTGTFKSTNTTPYEVSVMMREAILYASKVICLDCDLSEERMDLIVKVFKEDNDDETPQLYNCSHNSWADYTYNIYRQNAKMMSDLNNDLFEYNKRVLYATTSRNDATTIFEMMKKRCEQTNDMKNIMVISSEGVEYVVNGVLYNKAIIKDKKTDLKYALENDEPSEKIDNLKKAIEFGKYASSDKTKLFNQLEDVIIDYKLDCLIYTPSIKCGISFGNSETELLFDTLYGYATNGSITAREFLQMLHRCRHLKDKRINFYVKNDLTATTQLINDETIKTLIERNQQLKFNDDDWWKENDIDMMKFNIDEFYKNITITNFKEMIDSERNYSQEILGKLQYNHNMRVNIINKFSNDDDVISTKDEYDETKNKLKLIQEKLYQYEPKISRDEYDRLCADKQNTDTFLKRDKFKNINSMNFNNTNSKLLRDERDFDKKKQELLETLHIEKRRTNGIFQNYTTNKHGHTYFYEPNNDYCDEIIYEKYDVEQQVQYSENLAKLRMGGSIDFKKHFTKLNNEIISEYVYDAERTESDFVKYDIEINKLKLTKSLMDILGINRVDLIYKRTITTNIELKKLFDLHKKFIVKQLLYFINKLDTSSVEKEKLEIKEYKSSNKKYYSYVKSKITSFLGSIGIKTLHLNKSGGIEKNGNDEDKCYVIFQYETLLNTNRTFINTYYDTIENDLYHYQYAKQRHLHETLIKDETAIQEKTRKKSIDRKYHNYRDIIYKKNRHIKVKMGDVETTIKFPFNLLTADFIYDENDNMILLKKKNNDERISIWLKIELNNPLITPSYDMSDIKKIKNDTRYYDFKDVVWTKKNINGVEYYEREQVNKITTNAKTEDVIIDDTPQTTEEICGDVLCDMISAIETKDNFKQMVNNNIHIGGEQDTIAEDLELLRKENVMRIGLNSNDIHYKIHRPNIYVK